jgi:predicted DNA-binding mobile mystery protein A
MEMQFRAILLEGLQQKFAALNGARSAASTPARGWLRAVREATGITQAEVASKMAVKRQSYAQFENAEEAGAISLASLRRASEAMGCELFYFVVPRESVARSFADLAQIHDPAAMHLKATEHSMALKRVDAPQDAR